MKAGCHLSFLRLLFFEEPSPPGPPEGPEKIKFFMPIYWRGHGWRFTQVRKKVKKFFS
jgi:hypothetical protein